MTTSVSSDAYGVSTALEIKENPRKILNRNVAGFCSEQCCGMHETQYISVNFFGINFFISLCDRHANQITERLQNLRPTTATTTTTTTTNDTTEPEE